MFDAGVKFFVGPMSKNVVDAVIEVNNDKNLKIGFIPSRRQVEYNGGYVNNWATESFSEYVKSKNNTIAIERDHGGPGQGYKDDDGIKSYEIDAKYFDIIHIDPWKKYQKEFRKLEIEKVRSDLSELSIQLESNSKYNVLKEELLFSEKKLEGRKNELNNIVNELTILEAVLYKNNQLYQFAKADLDVLKYDYEKSQFGHIKSADIEKKYFTLKDSVDKYFLIREQSETKIDKANETRQEITKEISLINGSLTSLTREKNMMERKLSKCAY